MNETINTLLNRKSVRVFTDKAISLQERETILNAAFHAPTAGNQQLYTIIEITDDELKNKMAVLCDNQPFIAQAKLILVFVADCRRWLRAYNLAGCDARKPGAGDLLLAYADSCIAAQSAVIAAESMGIGSCYIGDVLENCELMRDTLSLPLQVVPAAMVVFGYPTEQQASRKSPARFEEQAVVCQNGYVDRTDEQLKQDFIMRAKANATPNYSFDEALRAFCNRKYESAFSKEMTRSAEVYIKEFIK